MKAHRVRPSQIATNRNSTFFEKRDEYLLKEPMSKLPIAAQGPLRRDKSLLFSKKSPNACIYAKFVVPLHPELKKD